MSRDAERRPERSKERDGGSAGPPGRIALGVTGGIAAYKAAEVVRGLVKAGCEVHVLMTAHAREFITPLTLQTLSGQRVIADPWDLSHGADIQHVTLARGLDLFLVAPATGDLACGEEGVGRVAEPETIVGAALALLKKKAPARLRDAASS